MSDIKAVDIKGLLDTYEFPYTLPGSGEELLIKPITTGQMKRILVYEDEVDPYIVEEALDKLISSCVVNEDFDIDKLYLQDRFSLMLELRRVTKGDMYEFQYKCPKCRVQNLDSIKISELPVKPLDRGENVITINDKLKFELDFPTRGGQKIAVERARQKNLSNIELAVEAQTGTYASAVTKVHAEEEVLENVSLEDKIFILDNIISDVFDQFTNWFSDKEFGVEFAKDMKCFSCGHEQKMDIPLSDFFV